MTAKDQVYGRVESVEKDLVLLATKNLPDGNGPQALARIWAFTAGYLRDFDLVPSLDTGLGADATVYSFPSSLDRAYGSSPVSFHGFLRLRWGPHGMQAGHGHHMAM